VSDGRPDAGQAQLLSTPSLLVLAVVAFVVEVALFGGVGAIAYAATGGGLPGWLAAIAGTVGIVILWGLFMAPKARFRVGSRARVVLAALLCLGTAYGLVQAGLTVWGWFVGLAGVAVVAAQLVLPTHRDT
jgi:hypothetical protein